jgi:large subunit ribosomal protein L21
VSPDAPHPVNLFLPEFCVSCVFACRALRERPLAQRVAGLRGSVPSEREIRVYAIVRSGGRQHKVAVGDIVEVDKIPTAKVGDTVELSTLLVVDGDAVTSDPWVLAGIKV